MASVKNNISSLQLIHRSMLIGLIVFCIIGFLMNSSGAFEPIAKELDHVLQVVVILLATAGFFIGNNYFKRKVLQQAQELQTAHEKLSLYRHAAIIQWTLLEGPAIVAIISFLLTGNYAFLALAATILLLFAMAFPAKQKILLLLSITENEWQNL